MAGRYDYETAPDDVFRRHDNCGCSTIYENGRQRQDVWSKKTWEVPEGAKKQHEPVRLDYGRAKAVESQNLEYRGLDNFSENITLSKPKNTFIEAKSIEEAEKFALEHGIRHVDYSDLSLEMANTLNEAAMTLPEDIRPAYIGSGKSIQKVTGAKFSRKEKDYYGVHVDALQFRFGEYPNIEYDFEGGQCVGISTAYKTPDKIRKSKIDGNKKYAEKHDGHTQFFNTDGKSTPFHEMGHVYADKRGIPDGFEADAKRWYEESNCDMLKSKEEAWAEAWGAYHTKNPDLPEYIAKYIENATASPIDKSQKSGIIKSRKPLKVGMQFFADIPKEKFTKYALDPIKQPDKARAFKEALGYTMDNYQELIENIADNLDENALKLKGSNEHGKLYEYVMQITGANGKQANVCTGWIIENGKLEPRLTSAYVTDKKVTKND